MEGYPRGPEISRETAELLKSPEQVFDSDLEQAKKEAQKVAERILRNKGSHRESRGVEVDIETESAESKKRSKRSIQITWAGMSDQRGIMLSLDPISEGKGIESGVLAYKGRYGVAKRNSHGEFDLVNDASKILSLEELFHVPSGMDLYVKPTVTRWAIGQDEVSLMRGENARTLYMGMGFLLLGEKGHKWMHIGMHEAGHLPNENDENRAWTTANTNYAGLYHDQKESIQRIKNGQDHGKFDLLEKPFYGTDLTIGKIMRYGLVSHALAGNARIPYQWAENAKRTMSEFGRKIVEAQEAFDSFFR